MSNAIRLLRAIQEKTGGGRDRGVRDVAELETGLTAKAARDAWQELLDQGLIERFSQKYAARLSFKGIDFLSTGAALPELRPATARVPSVIIARVSAAPARVEISNFLAGMDIEAIALEGPGLMQKMEAHHALAFGIALLAPEDLRATSTHVLMDLGYLMGRFGSTKVLLFAIDPADDAPVEMAGLPLHRFDVAGSWKTVLADELGRAGLKTSDS